MGKSGLGEQQVQVPTEVVRAVEVRVLMGVVQFIRTAEFEFGDQIPHHMREVLVDGLMVMLNGEALGKTICDHCEKMHTEHPLRFADGKRPCPEFGDERRLGADGVAGYGAHLGPDGVRTTFLLRRSRIVRV